MEYRYFPHAQSGAHVEVQLAGMTSTTYDLVVGADGVHSILRTAIAGDDAVLRRSAMTGSSWRFVVANPGVDCWTVWSGAAATLLLIPVGDGDVYGYASSTRGGATGDDKGWLAETFAGFARPVGDVIAALLSGGGQLHHSLVEEVRLPTWHRDRLVVIGDAAHATGPVWAQGAAMAMEDALVLAEVLAVTSDWSKVGKHSNARDQTGCPDELRVGLAVRLRKIADGMLRRPAPSGDDDAPGAQARRRSCRL